LEDIVSVRGNFPKDDLFTKIKRNMLLNLTCVKDDPGDLESWIFRELDQSQFGSIEAFASPSIRQELLRARERIRRFDRRRDRNRLPSTT
jgi:hypothetical protein